MWDECNCVVVWTFFGIAFLWDESTSNAGDLSLILGLERSPGEGKGYLVQYSGLENSMDCIVLWSHKEWDMTEWLSLSLFFGIGMKTDLFQSCGLSFPNFLAYLSAVVSQHHLLGFEITGIPSPSLALFVVMLPTWLHIPGCLALGEWSHHCGYLGHEDLLCTVLLCILATFLKYLLLLLGSYHFCPLSCPSFHEMLPWYLWFFLKRSLVFPILLFSPISLHWSLRKDFLSLLAILWNSAFKWVYLSFSPLLFTSFQASLVAQRLKHLPAMWETWVRSLGWEDSPGEGNGNPLQYSCLENPMDGGAWWATVHRVAKSRTQLSDFTFTM